MTPTGLLYKKLHPSRAGLILASLTMAVFAQASSIDVNTIYVSTISGQATSNGITLSSNVYIAPGSSLTLQGAAGYITTASSISASAFFGDASHLNGIAILTGTQTFTGANTYASSFTLQSGGRQIILSTSSVTNNFSISPDGTITFVPTIHNSSHTTIPEATTTNSTFGPCVAGSTLTITTSGGKVEIIFSGSLKNVSSDGGLPNTSQVNFLVDGGYVRDLTATKGFKVHHRFSYTYTLPITVDYLTDALSAGDHSFCLTLSAEATSTATLINSSSGNIFYVKEIK